ncbi:MAG TPA: hypothetical protein VFD38_01010 [Myxococcaceae bacterium]|nr:hypothetical protein [Myxococcaceae bacterium]
MNALWALMGLIAAAFVGSVLVARRGQSRHGLASGSGPVLAGFLLGPTALGLVTPGLLEVFTPLAQVGLGWLALIMGLDYGWLDRRRIPVARRVGGTLTGLLTMTVVTAATFALLRRLQPSGLIWWQDTTSWILAGGIGAACAETTQHAVRWVADRVKASGPVTQLLMDLADADDLGPLLLCGALFTLQPPADLRWATHPGVLWAGQIGLGVTIGLLTALLVSRRFRSQSLWGVLFGTSMVAIGLAVRADLSVLTVSFCMGLGLGAVSRHREAIRAAVLPAEVPLRLPALLLAGAWIDVGRVPFLAWVIPTVLGARVLAKALVAGCAALVCPPLRPAGAALVPGLLACGPTSMSIGLAFALRFPGRIGDTVLLSAAAATLLGELVAPSGLRAALRRVGEASGEPGRHPVVEAAA